MNQKEGNPVENSSRDYYLAACCWTLLINFLHQGGLRLLGDLCSWSSQVRDQYFSTYVTGKPLWLQCDLIHKGWNAMLSCWPGFTMWKENSWRIKASEGTEQESRSIVYPCTSTRLKQNVTQVVTGYIVHKGGDRWQRADRERTSEAIGLKDKWLI